MPQLLEGKKVNSKNTMHVYFDGGYSSTKYGKPRSYGYSVFVLDDTLVCVHGMYLESEYTNSMAES